MGVQDIRIVEHPFGYSPVYRVLRDDRDTSSEVVVSAGEPLKQNAAVGQFAVRWVDLDVTIDTDQPTWGVAALGSTETATADGNVDVFLPLPGIVYEARSLLAASTDTQSEIDALRGELHVIDLTSAVYTVDIAAGSAAANALLIVGGNPDLSRVRFQIRSIATVFGSQLIA